MIGLKKKNMKPHNMEGNTNKQIIYDYMLGINRCSRIHKNGNEHTIMEHQARKIFIRSSKIMWEKARKWE
jgi:hypothetical protein